MDIGGGGGRGERKDEGGGTRLPLVYILRIITQLGI